EGKKQRIYFTHYLEQGGDHYIDSEMVFRINPDGTLILEETATQNPFRGGESRGYDKSYATMFARNLIHQGWEQATTEAKKEKAAESKKEREGLVPGTSDLIDELDAALSTGRKLDNRKLTQMADEAFNGTRAKGTYTAKDAYDALEVAVNRFVERSGKTL